MFGPERLEEVGFRSGAKLSVKVDHYPHAPSELILLLQMGEGKLMLGTQEGAERAAYLTVWGPPPWPTSVSLTLDKEALIEFCNRFLRAVKGPDENGGFEYTHF